MIKKNLQHINLIIKKGQSGQWHDGLFITVAIFFVMGLFLF